MARTFNGNLANHLDPGDPTSAQFSDNLTLMCFVKLASLATDQTMAGKWGVSTNQHEWMIMWDSSSAAFTGLTKNTGTVTTPTTVTGPTGNKAGIWYHVCLRQRATVDLFQDGKLVATSGTTQSFSNTSNKLLLGRRTDANPLNGAMAHVAVWDWAVPNSEILAIAQGLRRPDELMRGNLRGYWPLVGYQHESEWSGVNQYAAMVGTVGYSNEEPYSFARRTDMAILAATPVYYPGFIQIGAAG